MQVFNQNLSFCLYFFQCLSVLLSFLGWQMKKIAIENLKFQKNRIRHVFRLIFGWKSRIRWDKFNILILGGSNLTFWGKIGPIWPKGPILTQNAKFHPPRVKILNLSQRIRDFRPKFSPNTCLTRIFWIFRRKVIQGVPFGISNF